MIVLCSVMIITVHNKTPRSIQLVRSARTIAPYGILTLDVSVSDVDRIRQELVDLTARNVITFVVVDENAPEVEQSLDFPTTLQMNEAIQEGGGGGGDYVSQQTFDEVLGVVFDDLYARAFIVADTFYLPSGENPTYFCEDVPGSTQEQILTAPGDLNHNYIADFCMHNITITRSESVGAYTTDAIEVTARTLSDGEITLTFYPSSTDGGDVLRPNPDMGAIRVTSMTIPAQANGSGSFSLGYGADLGLRGRAVSQFALYPIFFEAIDDVRVSTGEIVSPYMYRPAVTPDGTHMYAIYYNRESDM